MRSRAYAVSLTALALGGLGLLVSYGMTWTVETVPLIAGAEGAVREQAATGRELYPLAGACGWVALASVGGIIATRSWGRALVALVALAAGIGGAAGGAAGAGVPERTGLGWLLAVLCGGLVAIAGVAGVTRGRSWPTLSGRYERRGAGTREVSAWETQDMGGDPTDDLVE